MRELYEDVWEQLPAGCEPYALKRRRRFMLGSVSPGERVLDLGCGDGGFTAALAQAGCDAVGADIAEGALARARQRHPGPQYELVPPHGPFGFADCEFDCVWASEVIEHVADTSRWLSEVRRVLRPGGRLALTTPYHGRVKNLAIALARFDSHHDPVGQHLRFFSRGSLRRVLTDFGFASLEITTAGGLPLLRESLHARARRT